MTVKTRPLLILFMIASCTRENGTSKPAADNGILYKIEDSVAYNGSPAGIDSTTYSYDESGKLARIVFDYSFDNVVNHNVTSYQRDNLGRTTRIVQKNLYSVNGVPQVYDDVWPGDSITTEVTYKGSQIDHLFLHRGADGQTKGDSVVYIYTGSTISSTRDYKVDGGTAALQTTDLWTLNNAGQLISSSTNATDSQGRADYTFTYDGKVNPVRLGDEELPSRWSSTSPDNLTKQVFHSPHYGTTYTVTWTFSYRQDGRPLRGVSGGDAVNQTIIANYFYR